MIFLEQKFTMWTVYGKRLSFASETNYNYAEINALISLSVSLLCLVFGGDDKLIIAVEIRCTWIQIALGMRNLLVPKTNISLFFFWCIHSAPRNLLLRGSRTLLPIPRLIVGEEVHCLPLYASWLALMTLEREAWIRALPSTPKAKMVSSIFQNA